MAMRSSAPWKNTLFWPQRRTPSIPCSVEEATKVLEERSKAGIIPREPRKGFYKLYTDHALSAMKGAGLE